MKIALSVLLPAHNREGRLRRNVLDVLEVAEELTSSFEVLIVDDGSRDHTYDVALGLAMEFRQVGAMRHDRTQGLAAVIRSGMSRTSGQIVCVHEGGESVDVTDLCRLWRRRDEEGLVLARHCRSESRPRRWLGHILRHDGSEAGRLSAGFQMLRREAVSVLTQDACLIASPNEVRVGTGRPGVAVAGAGPKFLRPLRQLAEGE